jgi:hypothetical protein
MERDNRRPSRDHRGQSTTLDNIPHANGRERYADREFEDFVRELTAVLVGEDRKVPAGSAAVAVHQ